MESIYFNSKGRLVHRIIATFQNGRIELNESVDWPNGIKVEVTPLDEPTSVRRDDSLLTQWPEGFFTRLHEQWGDEPFDRPPQGEFETREDW